MNSLTRLDQVSPTIASALLSLVPVSESLARPVSFLGGWALMVDTRELQTNAMAGYTFFRNGAAGLHAGVLRNQRGLKHEFAFPSISLLPLRLNEEGRQSNVYLTAGYGIMGRTGTRAPQFQQAWHAAVDADTETRFTYLAVHSSRLQAGQSSVSYTRFRLGATPYQAGMAGLHAFVVLQADREHEIASTDLVPLLRFFYQNLLWEFGVGVKGKLVFNWAAEF